MDFDGWHFCGKALSNVFPVNLYNYINWNWNPQNFCPLAMVLVGKHWNDLTWLANEVSCLRLLSVGHS